eukprot:SAG11_NODE_120_length_15879_cov_8.076933_4_plen_218_part_00
MLTPCCLRAAAAAQLQLQLPPRVTAGQRANRTGVEPGVLSRQVFWGYFFGMLICNDTTETPRRDPCGFGSTATLGDGGAFAPGPVRVACIPVCSAFDLCGAVVMLSCLLVGANTPVRAPIEFALLSGLRDNDDRDWTEAFCDPSQFQYISAAIDFLNTDAERPPKSHDNACRTASVNASACTRVNIPTKMTTGPRGTSYDRREPHLVEDSGQSVSTV